MWLNSFRTGLLPGAVAVTCFLIAVALAQDKQIVGVDVKTLERIQAEYGEAAIERLLKWQALMNSAVNKPELEKLKLVNDFFNQQEFIDDILHWGQEDYWASPTEFLSTNGGDCEDFSVAKYFTLKAIGIPEDRIYLTYVKSVRLNQAHMVVTFFENPGAVPLVLDNLDPQIRPATRRNDLLPVFSFNGDGLWLSKKRGKGKSVGQASRLKRWRELLMRMQEENPALIR